MLAYAKAYPKITHNTLCLLNDAMYMYVNFSCVCVCVCVCVAEELDVDVDVEGTDCMLGDLEWSCSSVSDWDERASWRSSGSDEGYSSASLRHLAPPQENSPKSPVVGSL